MKHQPLFTVIVAGHQCALYLPKALDSLARQSFTDFDVLCYVEESTDDSLGICQMKAAADPRFTVATGPKSGGVGATRNYGIDHADGKYLVVLDGDDWVAEDLLTRLATKIATVGEVDVLTFKAIRATHEDAAPESSPTLSNFLPTDADGVFTGLEAIRRSGRDCGRFHALTWLSIYRVAFLRENGIRQPGGIMEDYESTPRIWFLAKRFAYLDAPLYFYRVRPDSITTSAFRVVFGLAEQINRLMDFVFSREIPADILRIWSTQWTALLFWMAFHPTAQRRLTTAERRKALERLMAGNGKRQFRRLLSYTSAPRRIAYPLIELAARGFGLPARLYFKHLYYPLIARRSKQ